MQMLLTNKFKSSKSTSLELFTDDMQEHMWHDQKIDVFSQVQECRSNK